MIQGTSISLQYSLGISVFPEDAKTKTELIMYADDAMYYIKENGKNGYYFHNKSLKAKLDNKNKMEKDLKEAYDKNEFSISLQPRINLMIWIIYVLKHYYIGIIQFLVDLIQIIL